MTTQSHSADLWGNPPAVHVDRRLAELYRRIGRTLDDLPYTDDMKSLLEGVQKAMPAEAFSKSERALFRRLLTLRKRALLPRLGPALSGYVELPEEDQELLKELVEAEIGRIALRDQLPYSPEFERVMERFNRGRGARLEPHDAWRVICRLAK